MERFFLFSGLEQFTKANEEDNGHDHDHDDVLFWDAYGRDGLEMDGGDADEESDEEAERFQEELERHELVRDAQAFERLCETVVIKLHKTGLRGHARVLVPTAARPAFLAAAALAESAPALRLKDREAVALARSAARIPEYMAEALVAEVSGQRHRDCDPQCVAYDIEWLTKTQKAIARAGALLERLFARYPSCRKEILRALDKGRMIEVTVGRRIVDLYSVWMRKTASGSRRI